MKTLFIFVLSFVFTSTAVFGATQVQIKQAEKDVKKGIYINDVGVKVSKPDEYICKIYRSTHIHYKDKTDWLLAVVKRGC